MTAIWQFGFKISLRIAKHYRNTATIVPLPEQKLKI
jgi:hypothetical protein